MPEAVIDNVRIAAAHEGVAELVVILRHPNGGLSEVALDNMATNALMQNSGATRPEELIGTSWHQVRDALAVSWNRFQPN